MGRGRTADRRGAVSATTLLAALLLFLVGASAGLAAPVVPPADDVDVTALCGLGAAAPADCDNAARLPHADPAAPDLATKVSFGGGQWSTTAAHLDYAGTAIAPIPLPAAGWLILAGLGALGLMRRRRAAGLPHLRGVQHTSTPHAATGPDRAGALDAAFEGALEPLAGALRGSALTDTDRFFGTMRRRARRLSRAALLERLRCLSAAPMPVFPPGTASPAVPCGCSSHRHSPLAERAPPARARRTGPRPVPGALPGQTMSMSPFRRHVPAPLGRMAVPFSRPSGLLASRKCFPGARDSGVGRNNNGGINPLSRPSDCPTGAGSGQFLQTARLGDLRC